MKKRIDRFILKELISESGGGSLYLADELLPEGIVRPVAVKLLGVLREGDRKAEERFRFEVGALVALGAHPNLVSIYSIGIAEGLPWIAMEFLPRSVAALMSEAPAAPASVSQLIRDVATGLSVMHRLNPPLLHNDLKPANILLDVCGNHKLADFGLITLVGQDRTRPMATVHYSAPELLNREFGRTCPATDLYALGHIAYELALGGKLYRPQFPAVFEDVRGQKEPAPQRWMSWHSSMTTTVRPVAEVRGDFPRPLSDIIAKLMAKPLAERFGSGDEVLAALGGQSDPLAGATSLPHAVGFPAPPVAVAPPPPPTMIATETPPPLPPALPSAFPAPSFAADDADLSSARYYIRFRGQVTGPYDLAALKIQARKGTVSRLHQISTDRTNWKSISTLSGVF